MQHYYHSNVPHAYFLENCYLNNLKTHDLLHQYIIRKLYDINTQPKICQNKARQGDIESRKPQYIGRTVIYNPYAKYKT